MPALIAFAFWYLDHKEDYIPIRYELQHLIYSSGKQTPSLVLRGGIGFELPCS